MTPRFLSQGHAEDVLLWHRFNYYVMHAPRISDMEYDALERMVRECWSVGVVLDSVGSDDLAAYPRYIQEGRWPDAAERALRDRGICEKWMSVL
jgi:hypothetical protein